MDINEIYSLVRFIANKSQSGYITPEEFNNAFNLSQDQYFHQLIEALQGWDANRRRIRLPMGNAQQVIQKLAPFIVKDTSVVVPGTGVYPKPGDLSNLLAIRSADNTQRVWRVEHDRVFSHASSTIDLPEETPFYTEYNNNYQIYPITIGTINVDYLRTPPNALWAYTVVSGRPVYDIGSSIQPLWQDTEITELIIRILFMFGISIQASQLVQYYGSVKNDGQ